MRVTKNDILVDVYTVSQTVDAEGFKVATYTQVYNDIPVDIQPLGGKVNVQDYGLVQAPAMGKILFFNEPVVLNLGYIVEVSATERYQVRGLSKWYAHGEAILELYRD